MASTKMCRNCRIWIDSAAKSCPICGCSEQFEGQIEEQDKKEELAKE